MSIAILRSRLRFKRCNVTYKSCGIDQIPAELLQTGGNTLRSETHKLINSFWNNKELPEQFKKCIIVLIYKKGDETIVIIKEYDSY
jgi:hypothetical protein